MTEAERIWRLALLKFNEAKPEEKARARANEQAAFSAYLRDNTERAKAQKEAELDS